MPLKCSERVDAKLCRHPLSWRGRPNVAKNKSVRQINVTKKEDFLQMISQLNYINEGNTKDTVDIEGT